MMASADVMTKRKPAKNRRPAKAVAVERRLLVDSIMGKYAWVPYSSEDFNRDRRREIALELMLIR